MVRAPTHLMVLAASSLVAIGACASHVELAESPEAVPVDAGPPPHPFACAEYTCDANSEYCLHWVFNGGPEGWECQPYPDACVETPTCDCIQDPYSVGDCPCFDYGGEVEACQYNPG